LIAAGPGWWVAFCHDGEVEFGAVAAFDLASHGQNRVVFCAGGATLGRYTADVDVFHLDAVPDDLVIPFREFVDRKRVYELRVDPATKPEVATAIYEDIEAMGVIGARVFEFSSQPDRVRVVVPLQHVVEVESMLHARGLW